MNEIILHQPAVDSLSGRLLSTYALYFEIPTGLLITSSISLTPESFFHLPKCNQWHWLLDIIAFA